jgi:hypothetical protein
MKIRGERITPDQKPKHNEHLKSSLKKELVDNISLIFLKIDPYFKI